jgi:hypothetical protein
MSPDMDGEFRRLVEEYRARCLWYLRPDYMPEDVRGRLQVLEAIATHGDLAALPRVARLRSWLSPHSSDASRAS